MNEDLLPFSITTARKLLGKAARNLSDKDILKQMEVAQMLKDVFFVSQMYQKVEFKKGGENENNGIRQNSIS
jgi:hypothetical protein